jgi:hypothetical protein
MSSPFRDETVESANGAVLYALINGDLGWLMYLRESGDAGFSSRNPDYSGSTTDNTIITLARGHIQSMRSSERWITFGSMASHRRLSPGTMTQVMARASAAQSQAGDCKCNGLTFSAAQSDADRLQQSSHPPVRRISVGRNP